GSSHPFCQSTGSIPKPHVSHSDYYTYPYSTLGCVGQPAITGIIPSSTSTNIPLRNLTSPGHPSDDHSTSLLQETNEKASRHSSDSAGSDFSLWSDTGDLAEQLANEEDPLQIKLRESFDGEVLGSSESRPRGRAPKHVTYLPQDHLHRKKTNPGIDKEAIQVPDPPPRQISRTEKVLAIIMTGDRSRSQTHGLTGKPLL
ncbi:MAG: hypothetical protein Q9214_000317, partial [Letrouitia sp. 1 TL-2023]